MGTCYVAESGPFCNLPDPPCFVVLCSALAGRAEISSSPALLCCRGSAAIRHKPGDDIMAESSSAIRPKDLKKKDKKRKREEAAPSSSAAGFSLLGAQKDAELDDIFGKSVSATTYVLKECLADIS